MSRYDLNPKRLKEYFRYDSLTGKLFWKRRVDDVAFNGRFAGKEAFTYKDPNGYMVGQFLGHGHKAHIIIWAMCYGRWPEGQIDHISGDKTDNRLENLRDVPRQENLKNCVISKNNNSGVMGVSWDKARKKWAAKIMVNRKTISLGRFRCITAAAVARKLADEKYGFHPNHGRQA